MKDEKEVVEQLVEYEQVPNTPFTIVKQNDKWFVTMGKYRLSEQLETKQEALEESQNESWFRMMQIMRIMIEQYEVEKETLALIKKGNPDVFTKKETGDLIAEGLNKLKDVIQKDQPRNKTTLTVND